MRILLDTDVVLDFLLAREPFAADARAIWQACAQRRAIGYVSAITPVNVFYIGRKQVGAAIARQRVADMLTLLSVASVDDAALLSALALPMADYEDAVQVASAIAADLDAIVTRNTGDYAGAPILVLTPSDCLARLPAAQR